LEEQKRIEL
jgi:ankyrin repeat protein